MSHFNAHSHFRTQSHEDARRRLRRTRALEHEKAQRRARGLGEEDADGSLVVRFFVVLTILGVAGIGGGLGRWMTEVSAAQGDTGSKRLDGTMSVNSARTGLGQQIKDR